MVLRVAAALCWTASLFLPAFTEELASSKQDTWTGLMVLAIGWMAMLIACPAWLALSWFIVPYTGGVPYDDGRHRIVSFNLGMYVWFLSFVIALVGAGARVLGETHQGRS